MFYPTAPAKPAVEEELDEAVEAAGIIAQMDEGEEDKIVLVSRQLAGRNCFAKMAVIHDKVIEERNALRSVSIADAKTQTEYIAKLTEKAVYADPAKWLAAEKLSHSCSTWSELKLAVAPVELEEVVEKK